MTNRQRHFFNIAREISLMSEFKKARVGAVVVKGNRIISTGVNSNKPSTMQARYNFYRHFNNDDNCIHRVHAEMAALTPLIHTNIDWSQVSIYTYRELKDGTVSCSRPCEACSALIKQLGIKNVFYTDWDGSFVKEEKLK